MWDQRYDTEEYAYGTEPNDFLKERSAELPVGRTLCIADGEGRNGVFLAGQGHDILSVDASAVGTRKTLALAEKQGVSIQAVTADLADYDLTPESFDCIVSISAHMPPQIRQDLHRRCVAALKPGGILLLEAYTPKQIAYKTGGPPVPEMMMSEPILRNELAGLEFLHLQELERDVIEGKFHTGKAHVVQCLARKPS